MTVLLSRQRPKRRLGGLRRRGWSTQFGRPKGFVPALSLVADECGKILGHVILSYVAPDTGQRLPELGPLSVCPERRGQGIGGDLVRTALGIADELERAAGSCPWVPRLTTGASGFSVRQRSESLRRMDT